MSEFDDWIASALQVLLCSARPSFKVLATLPLEGASGLQWACRQLYVLTATHLYLVFVGLPNGESSPPLPSLLLLGGRAWRPTLHRCPP